MPMVAEQHIKRDVPNYRYVITVDRGDPPERVLTQGHRRRDDARLAFAFRIQEARKKFQMPNVPLSSIATRSDRRTGILDAVKVGPETITVRRRNPSDVDIVPPPEWARPRPLSTQIKEGIRVVVLGCLYAGFLGAVWYGLYFLTYDPDFGFETKQECDRALFRLEYASGHHGDECDELENGHWWIFDIDGKAL
jgi:hypothetical protein